MHETQDKRIVFLGCALDPDERQEAVHQKLELAGAGAGGDNPYDRVLALLRDEVAAEAWREAGCLETPDWLMPVPPAVEAGAMSVDNFVRFIDGQGCQAASGAMSGKIDSLAEDETPCLIAVDHSLTGGALAGLAARHGAENISLVVLDSHLDAVPVPVTSGAIAYDMETNPQSVYDPDDPFLRDRPDSYNASTFLHHLLDEGVVLAKNLFVAGISDYPPKRAFRIKDPRIKDFVKAYSGLRTRGARVFTKKDLAAGAGKLAAVLRQVKTPYLYLSVDMDIGAMNACNAVRFRNWPGLSEPQIYRLVQAVRAVLDRGVQLAGMDVTEFNHRLAEPGDRTYRIAANLIEMICFNMQPVE